MKVIITKSNRPGKKWRANFEGLKKTVHFGQEGAEDYTMHKDAARQERYVNRHNNERENWTTSGITTAGFWSRWLLWNKPSLKASAKDIEKRFNVKIQFV
jgi:hypothetical protein